MAGKADFTPTEWDLIRKSPLYATLTIVAAEPNGPIGVMKEMFSVAKFVAETKMKGGANGIITDLVAELSTREGAQAARPDGIQGKSPDEARQMALAELKKAGELADAKAAGDAAGFKEWLQEVSTRVAKASKEGGFFGIGGTLVSEKEQQALADTASALGLAKA
jgi:hypothetical protein